MFSAFSINPYRIFPFDTGAWGNGLYKTYCNFPFDFDAIGGYSRFELPNDLNYLPIYISVFWGSNDRYLNENYKSDVLEDASNCINELYELIKNKNDEIDNRMRTPEVSTQEAIDFSNANQKPIAVIMHKACMGTLEEGAPEFIANLTKLGIEYLNYGYGDVPPPESPNNFIPSIKEIIINLLPKIT